MMGTYCQAEIWVSLDILLYYGMCRHTVHGCVSLDQHFVVHILGLLRVRFNLRGETYWAYVC